jgi:hypothetical protein
MISFITTENKVHRMNHVRFADQSRHWWRRSKWSRWKKSLRDHRKGMLR